MLNRKETLSMVSSLFWGISVPPKNPPDLHHSFGDYSSCVFDFLGHMCDRVLPEHDEHTGHLESDCQPVFQESDCAWTAYLSDQYRRTHVRPSSTVVGELREDSSGALLGRRHDPQADYHWHKGEEMDAAEYTFGQRKVLRKEYVEGRHCNDRNPCQKSALPSLWGVCGVVDDDQRLHETAHNKAVHGDDREPGDSCEPSLKLISVTHYAMGSDYLPEK